MKAKQSACRTIGVTCFAAGAFAAGQAGAQDSNSHESVGLEEITVTARRTSENLQRVPLTVNVVSNARLEQGGVSNTSELRNLVSNIYWNDNGGGSTENSVAIRGINSNAARQGFDSGVGIYIDDVYIADTTGFNTALLDIDRIEVLKGPQGTLFGRNTTAGVIAMHTRKPSTERFYSDSDLRLGNYNLQELRSVANLPLSDQLALKVSGIYRDRDGYQTNVLTGKRNLNDEFFYGGRAQLLFTPTDSLDVLLSADWFRNDDHQNVYSCWGGTACSSFNPTFGSIAQHDLAGDNGSYTKRKLSSASLNVTWRAPAGFEVTSITAYQTREYYNLQDQDYTGVDGFFYGYRMKDDTQFSQELRVATPSENRLRGVAGVYYFDEDRSPSIPGLVRGDFIESLGGPPGEDVYNSVDARLQTRSMAVFGQATYEITPTITAELGLRYTRDEKDFTYQTQVNPAGLALPDPIRAIFGLLEWGPLQASDSWGRTTGLVSLSWQPTDSVNTYVRYSQGYKSGAFQATVLTPEADLTVLNRPEIPVKPELLDSWEIGAKTQWLDNRVRLNASVFLMNYTDIQIQITDPETEFKRIENAGEARSRGVELELSAVPLQGWTIDAGLGLLDTEFTKDGVVGGVAVTNYKGNRLRTAPHTTANLTSTYSFDVASDWEASVSGTVSYRSSVFLNAANNQSAKEQTLANARIGLNHANGWGVYLWGENLTDDRGIGNTTGGQIGLSVRNYLLMPPRTYGVGFTASF
jgi:iron complex outermembrane receptor protein